MIEAAERGEFEPDTDLAARTAEWLTAASDISRKRAVTVRLQERDIQENSGTPTFLERPAPPR